LYSRSIAHAVVALAIVTPLGAQQTGQGLPVPQIVTSGEGEVRATPDRATIFIGVQTRAATAAAAAAENARRQTAVIDTLRRLGLAADQITTTGYQVMPETRFDPGTQQARVTGYVVSNMVRAELRRVDQVAPVIDGALARGANQINRLIFSASNADQLRRAAMDSAVAQARADAEVLARAAGGRLGTLIELTSGGTMRPFMDMGMVATREAVQSTPIEPGQTTVTASVTTRWQFIP
jgi:uncharacterized protein